MEIGKRIHMVRRCPSTNDLAKELAAAGEEEGTAVIADEQTKGRGRMGKSWFSLRERGLYLSVILRPPRPTISLLPLAAGLAVRKAVLDSTGIEILLKWPNDLIWRKRKMGGILCESGFLGNRLNYVILGIGLNLNHDPEDFPPEIRQHAASLKMAKEEAVPREKMLSPLWSGLNLWYDLFLEGKERQIIRSFVRNSALSLGKKVAVATEKERFEGSFRGIDIKGRLILQAAGKKKAFLSGETQIISG
jgi:BirA family biotin operon repressor/biotin-[acetyl-CoA-carboxylase] ligase